MTIPTDSEPTPRPNAVANARRLPNWPIVTNWAHQVRAPPHDFFATLNARRSRVGGSVEEDDLASLLRHATMLRERRFDGRFGAWESRSAPSAGGLHALHLLCLPLERDGVAGLYDTDCHALRAPHALEQARAVNKKSVLAITYADAGTTLQIVADQRRYNACYDHAESLMWRDVGAITTVIGLVATNLGLVSTPLGRHGVDVVSAADFDKGFKAAGAIHIGSKHGNVAPAITQN